MGKNREENVNLDILLAHRFIKTHPLYIDPLAISTVPATQLSNSTTPQSDLPEGIVENLDQNKSEQKKEEKSKKSKEKRHRKSGEEKKGSDRKST